MSRRFQSLQHSTFQTKPGHASHFCFGCAGQKRQLRWLRHYLASVTTSILPRAVTTTALHVYDLRNKLVAASVTLPQVCFVRLQNTTIYLSSLPRLNTCIFGGYNIPSMAA